MSNPTPEEIQKWHRWHAVECNNRAWALSEKAERTAQEDDDLVHLAHAAAWHWSQVGTEQHVAAAACLLGRVHAITGNGKLAMTYAQRNFDFVTGRESSDWEVAFAHAVLAHAALASGDDARYRTHHAKAAELGDAIADPADKEIFMASFTTIPSP